MSNFHQNPSHPSPFDPRDTSSHPSPFDPQSIHPHPRPQRSPSEPVNPFKNPQSEIIDDMRPRILHVVPPETVQPERVPEITFPDVIGAQPKIPEKNEFPEFLQFKR